MKGNNNMGEKTLVSVIIPIYNVELYLEECIKSVINQTYKNLEIILIDDGSIDKSGEICDRFAKQDSRIKVIHKENEGLSVARNTGIDIAKGEYIQFVDADDYIDINMIKETCEKAIKYDIDIVTFGHYILNNGETHCEEYNNEIVEFNNIEAIQELMKDNVIRNYAWEKLIKRELFTEIRFPEGKRYEDIATTPLLFEKAKNVLLFNKPLYYYRQREGSILHEQTDELRIEYINTTIEVTNYLKKYEELKLYCDYSILSATVRVYNDIALYNLKNLLSNSSVQKMYDMTKKIMDNSEKEKFIVENMTKIFKVHLYFLIYNKDKYIKSHKYLPILCAEHDNYEK